MIDDRLPDEFYIDSEIKQFHREIRTSRWYRRDDFISKSILALSIHKDGIDTGIVMLLLTEDWSYTMQEVSQEWNDDSIRIVLKEVSKEMFLADEVYDSLLLILDASNLQYKSKVDKVGSDMLYRDEGIVSSILAKLAQQ